MARVTAPWLAAVIVTVGAAAAGVDTPLPPPPPQPASPSALISAPIKKRFTTSPWVATTGANVVGWHGSAASSAKEAGLLGTIAARAAQGLLQRLFAVRVE